MGEKQAALVPGLDTLHEGRSIWRLTNTLCYNLKPNLGPPSLRLATSRNNKPRITQDIRVQTGKLDEPIISPLLTLTVSLQLAALADLPGTREMSFWQTRAGPRLPPQLPNNRQIKTHPQIGDGVGCVVSVWKMSVFSWLDPEGGSTLCPCDQPLIVYLSLEGISSAVQTVCEKRLKVLIQMRNTGRAISHQPSTLPFKAFNTQVRNCDDVNLQRINPLLL